MYYTRTLGAALLLSLATGAHAANPPSSQTTLKVTATIPAMEPKLSFNGGDSAAMAYDPSTKILNQATKEFKVTANSDVSLYIKEQASLKHKSRGDATIALKISAKVADAGAPQQLAAKDGSGKNGVAISAEQLGAELEVRGQLVIEAQEASAIAKLPAGQYEGSVIIVVEVNDTDVKA